MKVLVWGIEGLASLHVNRGQLECATRLFAWADAMRKKTGEPRPLIEQKYAESDLAVIRTKLNQAEFAKFSEEGQAMTAEQAIALGLDPAEEITMIKFRLQK